jgi:hypothetical protein
MTMASVRPIWRKHTPDGGIVALHEATDMIHPAMCLAPNLPVSMVVEIAVESATIKLITRLFYGFN